MRATAYYKGWALVDRVFSEPDRVDDFDLKIFKLKGHRGAWKFLFDS
jgi:hypothetical protein